MLVSLFLLLAAHPSSLDKTAEEALENNQAMLDSIMTFHAVSEIHTQATDGKYILTSKDEQWKKKNVTKTTSELRPINGHGRKTIALSLDGLTHILYLPDYPPIARAEKMGHTMMPGNIYGQLGYSMADVPNKRSLSPSEMVQAGYRIISSKVEGKAGERNFTLTYNHNYSITISEQYNYLVTNVTESSKGYSWIAQASDIRQVAPGIYVPFKLTTEEKTDDKVSLRSEIRVKSAEVNQPIDPARFKLNMAPGGTMTDFTLGKGFFVDPEGAIIKENPEIKYTGALEKPSTPIVLSSPVHVPTFGLWRTIGIVAVSLLVIIAAFILIRRKVVVR